MKKRKKIIYTIENKTVFKNLLDTKYDLIVNFIGIYKGNSKKDCMNYLKERGLKYEKTK